MLSIKGYSYFLNEVRMIAFIHCENVHKNAMYALSSLSSNEQRLCPESESS